MGRIQNARRRGKQDNRSIVRSRRRIDVIPIRVLKTHEPIEGKVALLCDRRSVGRRARWLAVQPGLAGRPMQAIDEIECVKNVTRPPESCVADKLLLVYSP